MAQDDHNRRLINEAKTGDREAFDAIIGPLLAPAYQLALAMLGDRHEAQDVLQDAALKAWVKLAQVHDGKPVRPWFLAIVSNQCRMVRRRPWWTVVRLAEIRSPVQPSNDAIDCHLDLQDSLRRLTMEERLPLVLYYYLDLPMEEVSRVLGTSESAAKARIYRSVRRLRPSLTIEEALR